MPSALEPQGVGMAAICPEGYADDTQAIAVAPAAAPMVKAQAITDRTAVLMWRHRPVGQHSQVHLRALAGATPAGWHRSH